MLPGIAEKLQQALNNAKAQQSQTPVSEPVEVAEPATEEERTVNGVALWNLPDSMPVEELNVNPDLSTHDLKQRGLDTVGDIRRLTDDELSNYDRFKGLSRKGRRELNVIRAAVGPVKAADGMPIEDLNLCTRANTVLSRHLGTVGELCSLNSVTLRTDPRYKGLGAKTLDDIQLKLAQVGRKLGDNV